MLSFLSSHWRATTVGSIALTGLGIITVLLSSSHRLLSDNQNRFIIVGSFVLFAFADLWAFIVRWLDGINRRFKQSQANQKQLGIKFFFWVALIALPLVVIENLLPAVKSGLAFGVAACAGLIAGCVHALAQLIREQGEQGGDGDAEVAV